MKKAYRFIAILLVLTLALCACGKDEPETTVPTDPAPETTVPQIQEPVETNPPATHEPKETEPAKTGPDYDAYTELLTGNQGEANWIYQSLTCVFGQPEDIDLYHFFYHDIGGGWEALSEDSANYLVGQGLNKHIGLAVYPLDEMDAVLQKVFGISLSDVESGIPDRWRYVAAEKAYCCGHSDTNLVGEITITWIDEYAGNRVDVFYTINGSYYNTATGEFLNNPDMVLALRKLTDGSYQVLANLVAPTK